jgi:ribonuclease HI
VAYPGRVQICSDSSYVLDGIQKWVGAWRRNGWRTREGNPVANQALWEQLDGLVGERQRQAPIRWIHIPGHAGIAGNERVDAIASAYAEGNEIALFQGALSSYGFNPYDISVHPGKMAAKTQKNAKAYSYLSMVDGEIVIHKTWPECQARVLGKSGAKFKKSISAADEATIIQAWKK